MSGGGEIARAAFAGLDPCVRAIMVFDGHCVLCSATVQWVIRHDPERRIAFASAQGGVGARIYGASAQDADATFLLVTRDSVRVRSDAGLALLEVLGTRRAIAAIGRRIPRVLRDAVYDLVARNRYRVFGHRSTCAVPDAGERGRYLP